MSDELYGFGVLLVFVVVAWLGVRAFGSIARFGGAGDDQLPEPDERTQRLADRYWKTGPR